MLVCMTVGLSRLLKGGRRALAVFPTVFLLQAVDDVLGFITAGSVSVSLLLQTVDDDVLGFMTAASVSVSLLLS